MIVCANASFDEVTDALRQPGGFIQGRKSHAAGLCTYMYVVHVWKIEGESSLVIAFEDEEKCHC